MSPIADAVAAALLHSLWLGALVASLTAMALLGLRRRSANLRYLVSVAALAVLTLLPVAAAVMLYAPGPSAGAAPASSGFASPVSFRMTDSIVGAASYSTRELLGWVLPIWAIGVVLFSVRLLWAAASLSRRTRRGRDIGPAILERARTLAGRVGVGRRFRLLDVPTADGPGVVGWIRPVVLLPSATVLGLTTEQLDAVLAHELAHIRRHDYLVNLVQMVIETLLFFNPAAWWISGRIRHERELCCDDVAIAISGNALAYARALTKLERLRLMPRPAIAAAGFPVSHRIRRIIGAPESRGAMPSRLAAVVALAIAFSGALLTSGRLGAQDALVLPIPVPPPPPEVRVGPVVASPPESASVFAAGLVQQSDTGNAWVLYASPNGLDLRAAGGEGAPSGLPSAEDLGGGNVLWFRLDGNVWVVRDAGVLDQIVRIVTLPGPPTDRERREAEARINSAQARLLMAEADRRSAEAQVIIAQANVKEARLEMDVAELDLARTMELVGQEQVSPIEMSRAEIDLQSARVRIEAREAALMQAEAQIPARDAEIRQAAAALDQADVSLRGLDERRGAGIEPILAQAIETGVAVAAP